MDAEKNPVLSSGGRGFIGRAAGNALRGAGYRVISVDVGSASGSEGEVVCDIADRAQVHKLFQRRRVDAIVHLAAILPRAAQRSPSLATRVLVDGESVESGLFAVCGEFGFQVVPIFEQLARTVWNR